VCLCGPRH